MNRPGWSSSLGHAQAGRQALATWTELKPRMSMISVYQRRTSSWRALCLHSCSRCGTCLPLWMVHHYFRGMEYTAPASAAAHASMRSYACLMEQNNFPDKMFTYNLHMLVCRSVFFVLVRFLV